MARQFCFQKQKHNKPKQTNQLPAHKHKQTRTNTHMVSRCLLKSLGDSFQHGNPMQINACQKLVPSNYHRISKRSSYFRESKSIYCPYIKLANEKTSTTTSTRQDQSKIDLKLSIQDQRKHATISIQITGQQSKWIYQTSYQINPCIKH